MEHHYLNEARLLRVVDADTLVIEINVGFGLILTELDSWESRLRLVDVDAQEMSTPEGRAAREFTLAWCAEANDRDWPFQVETFKTEGRGNFGRYLMKIRRFFDGADLSEALAREGYLKPNSPRPRPNSWRWLDE